ncbi:MAG: 3-dehydroquinate synthase [Firmicutes bacterium]|nr:3-dehydroquinate synthase [Bacillota bacterium]
MKKFLLSTGNPYEVLIGKDFLKDSGFLINKCLPSPRKLCVITDSNVNTLYAQTLLTSLKDHGYETSKIVFPAGEHSKNLTTYLNIMEALADEGFTRSDALVALGGGVVGDLVGFAAATYLRGIAYVQIPTTYMAAVDSAVGGKTSINLQNGKNLAGAIWQPSLVLCDCDTFETLPPEKRLDGLAEAVKSAVVSDASLLEHIKAGDYEYVIERCVSIKKSFVEADERDYGLRQILGFGHTIGHGLEKLSSYTIPHGQAVAAGMVVEARAAYKMGLTQTDLSGALTEILTNLGFHLHVNYSAEDIYHYALMDKKINGDYITVVIPDTIGKCHLHKISLTDLRRFIQVGLNPA